MGDRGAAFVLMNLCCDLSMVPYNGFLAEIADEHSINRVSGYGFALGYLGGSLPLLAAVGIVWVGPAERHARHRGPNTRRACY